MTMMIVALALMAVAQVADIVTTMRGLKRGAVEANGAIAWLMKKLGKGWIVAKMVPVAGLVYISWRADAWWAVILVAALTGYVAWRNHRVQR